MTENAARDEIARLGETLYSRGLAHGSTGNVSLRVGDEILITPTNTCMGLLDPARISKIALDGSLLSGDPPSKEGFLHLAMYEQRPADKAIVHLHSTHSVGVSCLADIDPSNPLPPLTAYYVMKIGRLALVPYFRPGDRALADAVARKARDHHALLLANHGPVVSGESLDSAAYAMEELEETAKLYFLLRGHETRMLSDSQLAELRDHFPS